MTQGMQAEKVIWMSAFAIGLFLFVYGLVCWIRKTGKKEVNYAKAALYEFIATWILYIPEEIYNELAVPNRILRMIEGILTALLRSVNIYNSNGYERTSFENHMYFSSIYGILRVSVNIAMVVFVGGFIIEALDQPFQRIRMSLYKRRYTYLFSEYNDKTLALAESLPDRAGKNIVFISKSSELSLADRENIESIGGLWIDQPIRELIRKYKNHSEGMELFLFDVAEEERLTELDEVCRDLTEHFQMAIKIYVELSETPWDLYDDCVKRYNLGNKNPLTINFVRTEENFVYNDLLKNSIFDMAIPKENHKEINVLLIGAMKERNLEILKTVLYLAQMPGYRLRMMVIEDGAGREVLRQKMPEVYDQCDREGDAIYVLDYKENVAYESNAFDEIIEQEFADFTFVFVNAGSDLMNMQLAMRINAIGYRTGRSKTDYQIQVNIRNRQLCAQWTPQILSGISIVGSVEETYDYNFVVMSDLEKAAKAIHEHRYAQKKTWDDYCNNEYNRHSVYARTLSFKYKVQLIEAEYGADYRTTGVNLPDERGVESNIWKIYEHMRWNMYMRTLGYRLCDAELLNENCEVDREVRTIAHVHKDLVPFDELDEEEQHKDALQLTPEIVEILKTI